MALSAEVLERLNTRDQLRRRLEDGDLRIATAQQAGQDVAIWESFWIRLLREYEAICREIDSPPGAMSQSALEEASS